MHSDPAFRAEIEAAKDATNARVDGIKDSLDPMKASLVRNDTRLKDYRFRIERLENEGKNNG